MAGKKNPPPEATCSFCGRPRAAVKTLIAGPGDLNICDECVDICHAMVRRPDAKAGAPETPPAARLQVPKPHEIKARLDEFVVGQERVKKVLAVAVHNHYKRVQSRLAGKKDDDGVEIDKSNILMLGPPGCGTTLLARARARIRSRVPGSKRKNDSSNPLGNKSTRAADTPLRRISALSPGVRQTTRSAPKYRERARTCNGAACQAEIAFLTIKASGHRSRISSRNGRFRRRASRRAATPPNNGWMLAIATSGAASRRPYR